MSVYEQLLQLVGLCFQLHDSHSVLIIHARHQDLSHICSGAVELRNAIGRALALELPGTLVFDCPTAGDILRYILDNFQLPAASDSTPGDHAAAVAAGTSSSAPGTVVQE
jgi:Phosphopantetheine attachment site